MVSPAGLPAVVVTYSTQRVAADVPKSEQWYSVDFMTVVSPRDRWVCGLPCNFGIQIVSLIRDCNQWEKRAPH